MNEEEKKALELLKLEGKIYVTKDCEISSSTIDKLEAFNLIDLFSKHLYKVTEKFYKNVDKILSSGLSLEEFEFEDKNKQSTQNNNYNINGNVGQVYQGIENFHIDNMNISFVKEALKDLSSDQKNELNEVLKTKDKSAILKKIKSFGGDVVSNILANIITHPGLFN